MWKSDDFRSRKRESPQNSSSRHSKFSADTTITTNINNCENWLFNQNSQISQQLHVSTNDPERREALAGVLRRGNAQRFLSMTTRQGFRWTPDQIKLGSLLNVEGTTHPFNRLLLLIVTKKD